MIESDILWKLLYSQAVLRDYPVLLSYTAITVPSDQLQMGRFSAQIAPSGVCP
jgi:hypothetical protein